MEVEEESESLPSWVCGPLEMQGGQDHSGRCQSRDGRQPHGHRGDRESWPQETKKHVVRQRQRALPSCQACPLSSHPFHPELGGSQDPNPAPTKTNSCNVTKIYVMQFLFDSHRPRNRLPRELIAHLFCELLGLGLDIIDGTRLERKGVRTRMDQVKKAGVSIPCRRQIQEWNHGHQKGYP